MKKYNFDEINDRHHVNSLKYDGVPDDALSFTIADMDSKCIKEIKDAINHVSSLDSFGYRYVDDNYFLSYIRHFEKKNIHLSVDNFAFSCGVIASLDSLLNLLTNKGDKIALFSPAYNCFFSVAKNHSLELIEIPFLNDNFDIDYYALEEAFKNIKIFILCNPNNPNGKIFSLFELDKIIDLANKYSVTIISDEIHSDIVSPNKRSHSLLELDRDKLNNCYILYSPSKVFNLAGLHSSVVISLNKERLASIQAQLYKDNVGEPSYFALEPVIAAFDNEDIYFEELNQYIYENKVLLKEGLEKISDKFKVYISDATYLMWINIKQFNLSNDDFISLCKKYNLYISDGRNYGKYGDGFIRINVATNKETIKKLISIFNQIIKDNNL